jgi:hypothetical protein
VVASETATRTAPRSTSLGRYDSSPNRMVPLGCRNTELFTGPPVAACPHPRRHRDSSKCSGGAVARQQQGCHQRFSISRAPERTPLRSYGPNPNHSLPHRCIPQTASKPWRTSASSRWKQPVRPCIHQSGQSAGACAAEMASAPELFLVTRLCSSLRGGNRSATLQNRNDEVVVGVGCARQV